MHVVQSAQRFWDNDMHNTNLKRVARMRLNATRFSSPGL